MAEKTTPFPNLASDPDNRAALQAAARRWYELRPQYAKRLNRPELAAAWDAFEAAVLALDPGARFDFGDVKDG